jgi:hypothetical protein
LLGMPQRKNKTVTRMNGTRCPAGKRRDDVATVGGCEEEVCDDAGSEVGEASALGFIGGVKYTYTRLSPD